jgi:hypothetical protein
MSVGRRLQTSFEDNPSTEGRPTLPTRAGYEYMHRTSLKRKEREVVG